MKAPKAFIKALPEFRRALEEWDEQIAERLSELEDAGNDKDNNEIEELEIVQEALATINEALCELPKEAIE